MNCFQVFCFVTLACIAGVAWILVIEVRNGFRDGEFRNALRDLPRAVAESLEEMRKLVAGAAVRALKAIKQVAIEFAIWIVVIYEFTGEEWYEKNNTGNL